MEMSLLARMSCNQSPTAYPLSLQFFQDVHAAQIRYGACEFVATEIAAYNFNRKIVTQVLIPFDHSDSLYMIVSILHIFHPSQISNTVRERSWKTMIF